MVLVNIAVAAVGLLAVTLAAMALLTSFLQGFYGELIARAKGGLDGFFGPFRVVATVSAGAALTGFAGAMDSTTGPNSVRATLFGISIWLIVWAVAGAVGLVSNFVRYAVAGRRLSPITEREPTAASSGGADRPISPA